jgi:DNA-binding NarL/FixJ family response regulator
VKVSSRAANSYQKNFHFFHKFHGSGIESSAKSRTQPMRVLIADDQPGVGNTVALLVNAAKHHVVKVVSSGAAAIRAYHTYKPDVVLMDYSMAKLNGGTACRYILTEDPAARIVFVSSWPVADLVDIGAVAILPKPVDLKELEALLNHMDAQLVFDYARAR